MSDTFELPSAAGAPAPAAATLALPQLVAIGGLYPQRGDEGAAGFYLGMVQTFAGGQGAFGAPAAQGQLLPISANTALYSLFGTVYGGDGRRNFALPDLRGRVAIGGAPGSEEGQTLSMNAIIAAVPGAAPVGSVALFGGNFAPPGWLLCDGRSYSPDDFPQLYAAIQMTFGGDGGVFAVPNLAGRGAIGVGSGPGLPPVALGQRVDGAVSGLGLTPIICVQGIYPDPGGSGAFPGDMTFLGQMLAFAGPQPPAGWLPADGRLLPAASYGALYAVLGNAYGGESPNSFALPDLRGRMIAGG